MLWLLAVLLALTFPLHGLAVYSNPGVSERVLNYRLTEMNQDLRCDECVGYAAVADCSLIGSDIWIRRHGSPLAEGPFRVSDCANAKHRDAFVKAGRVVEVDGYTARRWRMAGPIWVEVYLDKPPYSPLFPEWEQRFVISGHIAY